MKLTFIFLLLKIHKNIKLENNCEIFFTNNLNSFKQQLKNTTLSLKSCYHTKNNTLNASGGVSEKLKKNPKNVTSDNILGILFLSSTLSCFLFTAL